jgi:hypothetical protein
VRRGGRPMAVLGALGLAVVLAGCGLGSWQPIPSQGTAPEVSLTRDGTQLILANESDRSYWLWPPQLQVWQQAGDEWTTNAVLGTPTAAELRPGEVFRSPLPEPSGVVVRISATLWPGPTRDPGALPWFHWLEVPPQPSATPAG